MALAIIGTPAAAAASTITLPTHAIGDVILLCAFRDGSTAAPSKPAASGTVPEWVDIDVSSAGGNACSIRTAYVVATAADHTSGTWTNATGMTAIVYRGQAVVPIGGHAILTGASAANSASAPAVTLSVSDGTSAVVHSHAHRAVTAWDVAPSGYTRQASVDTEICMNTKDVTTTAGEIAQACTAAESGWRGATVEVLALAGGIVRQMLQHHG